MALAIFLALLLIFLFLAKCTEEALRDARERRYIECALRSAEEFGVPLAMVLAVIRTESDFLPDAVSTAGAMGLMQLMPETFAFLRDEKLGEDLPDSAIFDPEINIRYGTYYLSYLYERFGSWSPTLAAYNAGESRVSEWLTDPDCSQNGTLTDIPFPETEAYVEKVLKAYQEYSQKYKE